jgi:hypothetical protein
VKRKIVHVTSHGPLSFSKTVEIGWEDVWLRTHSGRHPLRLAPCLVSREHLRSDIAMAEKIASDPKASTQDYHRQEADDLRALLEKLDARGYVMDHEPKITRRGKRGRSDPGRDFGLANVYTSRPWINHAEAERMLDSYLAAIGIRDCVYKWKAPSFFAWPTTLDCEAITAGPHGAERRGLDCEAITAGPHGAERRGLDCEAITAGPHGAEIAKQ